VASEVAEFRRQQPVGDLLGDMTKEVIARGLRKGSIGRRGFFDVGANRVDRAALTAGNPAQRVPRRVFEAQGGVAIAEADIARKRVGSGQSGVVIGSTLKRMISTMALPVLWLRFFWTRPRWCLIFMLSPAARYWQQ
jgi:hypothetical protein